MKHFLLLFLLLLMGGALNAQPCENSIKGYVYDRATNEPLPFASIQIEGTSLGAVADINGYFEITGICESEVHLVISMVGYKTTIHHHDVYHENPAFFLAGDSMMLESITVEGEGAKGDFFSLTGQRLNTRQIERNEDMSFGDMLSSISGVSTLSTGTNVVKPIIHGLHSNRILIIENDVRHEFQNWGAEHAPEIDASMLDQLTIIKGAAAVKYGPDALGGVIQVKSPQPRLHEGFYGKAKLSGYSNGMGISNRLLTGYGQERLAIQFQGAFQQNGDVKAPNYILSNTGMKEYSLNGGAIYHVRNIDLEAQYSHTYQKLSILRASVNESFEDLVRAIESAKPLNIRDFTREILPPYQEVNHQLAKFKSTYRSNGHVFIALYGYQFNNRKEVDLRRGSSTLIPSINLDLATHSLDLEWLAPSFNNWMISVGSQSLVQDNNNLPGTGTVPFVPNFNTYRSGFYGIASKTMNLNTWEIGLRYDYQYTSIRGREPDNTIYSHSLNFQNVTGSFGWVRELNPSHSLRMNIGTAWRPPNIYELYSFGKHQNAIEYGLWRYEWESDEVLTAGQVLDPDANPVNSELGLKWIMTWEATLGKIKWDLTSYVNRIDNYFYSHPAGLTSTVRGVFPYFIFDQTDALFTGVDFDLMWEHNKALISKFSGNYVYAKNQKEDTYFNAIPPVSLNHELMWSKEKNQRLIEVSLDNSWVARQFQQPMIISARNILEGYENGVNLVNRNTPTYDMLIAPKAYWLLGASVSYERPSWAISAKAENLLNMSYRPYTDRLRLFADEPGRNFHLSFSYLW
jgi:iron complex outermembrane receptor protein